MGLALPQAFQRIHHVRTQMQILGGSTRKFSSLYRSRHYNEVIFTDWFE